VAALCAVLKRMDISAADLMVCLTPLTSPYLARRLDTEALTALCPS
jgi:hypothetical protein